MLNTLPQWFTSTSVGQRVIAEAQAAEESAAAERRVELGEQLAAIDSEQTSELPKLEAAEAKALADFEQIEAKYIAARDKARQARHARESAVASWGHHRTAIRRQLCRLCPPFVYDAIDQLGRAAISLRERGVTFFSQPAVGGGRRWFSGGGMTQDKLRDFLLRIQTARNTLLEGVRYSAGATEDIREKVNAIVSEALAGTGINAEKV